MSDLNILIIEDDKILNQQLTELLTLKGYQVEQCFDGETGLLKATSQQHHLILLDVINYFTGDYLFFCPIGCKDF